MQALAQRSHAQLGRVDAQVDVVAEQIGAIPELKAGFDAIGFSQGAPKY